MSKKISKFYMLLSWTFLIFMLLTTPMNGDCGNVEKITIYDKIIHMALFGTFNIFLLEFLKEFKKINVYFMIGMSFFIGSFYSYLCEYTQLFVRGRCMSYLDFLAGVLGILLTTIYWFRNKIVINHKILD